MARELNKLSAVAVRNKSTPGLFADGGGLYLQVTNSGAKTWIYRFMIAGKRRDMGLGAVHTISLAEARDEALRCRQLVRQGIDPIEKRKAERLSAQAEAVKAITFKECAETYIKTHEPSWKNAKHIAQWTSTLKTYAYPVIGTLPIAEVDTGLVMKVIEPIWATKTETASRVRGRIESILDWATVRKYRTGENPARWKGHLDHLLPSKSKLQKEKHHSALPYDQISEFMTALNKQKGTSARALEFAILTAARTGEVIEAMWSEIDLENKIWTIPAERMKAGREHRVPLSDTALKILQNMSANKLNDFVFPGNSTNRPLSNMAMLTVLRRMKRTDITVHGFRSTFRDWAAEQTAFPREVAEMALAHTIESKVEAAYRRGDLYEKRKSLMDEWAGYCATERAETT
ncbi:tyrosine-type recombinase/integrase [Terasakiella sp. A23]|uniref:tyrosine-type recombinase/integrase n=1 Tax=Terasakiella sp. FCG-A23 TaxID=3080561 RepID=UPI00295475B8|nr:integrase arm-type DNA-binding domain-containing protein [Terasakiella sp. A23]MDV7341592.1 tyrosine-type recombinase/integrase [Terasakiella sp. A23]